nr:helix-turn-helix domain-containing protein [Nocardiopsis algeriensis]
MDLDDLLGIDAEAPEQQEADQDVQEFVSLIDALVELRKQQGLTQSDVASAMGTTQSAVSEIESVANDPRISTVQRYARAVCARLQFRVRVAGPALDTSGGATGSISFRTAEPSSRPLWHAPTVIVGGRSGSSRHIRYTGSDRSVQWETGTL